MTERIARLVELTLKGEMYATPQKTQFDRKDIFLSQEEMDVLMSDLLKSANPNIAPDGKTIIAVLTQENIDKMFA
jgi:DNA mismatch repair ATPase MutL